MKDVYSNRPLPHLIGSGDFFKDELVGLGESSGEGKYNFVLEVNQKVTILCGPSLNCQGMNQWKMLSSFMGELLKRFLRLLYDYKQKMKVKRMRKKRLPVPVEVKLNPQPVENLVVR